jgi:hypothetical protein
MKSLNSKEPLKEKYSISQIPVVATVHMKMK